MLPSSVVRQSLGVTVVGSICIECVCMHVCPHDKVHACTRPACMYVVWV